MAVRIPAGAARSLAAAALRKNPCPSAQAPRVRRKAPRLSGGEGVFLFEAEFPLEPRVKERARTFADPRVLESAFRQSGGDARDFSERARRGLMRTHTPAATRAYETALSAAARAAMSGAAPFGGPVRVEAVFTLTGDGLEWPVSTGDGDLDNMEKALLDALNGVVWTDDRLVVEKASRKRTGPRSSVFVRVEAAGRHDV